MSEKSTATLRRSPPRATPAASAARIAVTVPRETNFISSSRSLSWRIIAFIRAARSPISSRVRTPSTRAERSPAPTRAATPPILRIGPVRRPAKSSAAAAATPKPIEADEEQVAQHVVDDGVGALLAELGDDRPGKGVGEGVGAEHRLAVGTDVALDRLGPRAGDDERRGVGDDRPVGERARRRLEHGAAVGVDHRDLAAAGERAVPHQGARAARGRSAPRASPAGRRSGSAAAARRWRASRRSPRCRRGTSRP